MPCAIFSPNWKLLERQPNIGNQPSDTKYIILSKKSMRSKLRSMLTSSTQQQQQKDLCLLPNIQPLSYSLCLKLKTQEAWVPATASFYTRRFCSSLLVISNAGPGKGDGITHLSLDLQDSRPSRSWNGVSKPEEERVATGKKIRVHLSRRQKQNTVCTIRISW